MAVLVLSLLRLERGNGQEVFELLIIQIPQVEKQILEGQDVEHLLQGPFGGLENLAFLRRVHVSDQDFEALFGSRHYSETAVLGIVFSGHQHQVIFIEPLGRSKLKHLLVEKGLFLREFRFDDLVARQLPFLLDSSLDFQP